jgi:putative FmdB family regulatory protein
MPIFEYACDDCGTRFEKLVRRSAETEAVQCPSCGDRHVTTQYSTFAAHAGKVQSSPESASGCGSGMCGTNFCQGGMCGMDMN